MTIGCVQKRKSISTRFCNNKDLKYKQSFNKLVDLILAAASYTILILSFLKTG